MASIDRSRAIFGNEMGEKAYRKACKAKEGYLRRFGDDSALECHLAASELPAIGETLGVRGLWPAAAGSQPLDIRADAAAAPLPPETPRTIAGAGGAPVVVGNIRMGFGHYRIAMAMASAARAMGYTPYWLDLMGFPATTCSKIISRQNDMYSMASRLSQRIALFNKLVWEPLNSEGFRKLTYNASDQKVAELMTAPFSDLPSDVPFIGTHAWTAQAALHAGLVNVVNAIPDNWPMALHLAEGAVHTVQTPSSYLGYKTLRGMDKKRVLRPMPEGSIVRTGHYVDHELVANIEADCARRRARAEGAGPLRFMLSVGGAGAQQELFRAIIAHLVPAVEAGRAALVVNVGDHRNVWEALAAEIPALRGATCHFGDFDACAAFAEAALDGPLEGIHAFYDQDIFAAVYSTNLLMRCCDVLLTKPSELSFYPVPKIMIKRVGGHEAWGAIRSAEVGDGTFELETPAEICGFIDLLLAEPAIVSEMCANIEFSKQLGVYDGAYEVVALAVS